jgi:hypothetical protein
MLSNPPQQGGPTGVSIAQTLANHSQFKSHSRFIDRTQAKAFGLVIDDLEIDQQLQDHVLSVFHAVSHTLSGSMVTKIIENHHGKAFIKIQSPNIQIQQMMPFPFPMPQPVPGGPGAPASP